MRNRKVNTNHEIFVSSPCALHSDECDYSVMYR